MTALKYVGRRPDNSGYSIMSKAHVDAAYEENRVDDAYVTGAVQDVLPSLASQAYIDFQDSLRAAEADVVAADNTYIPLTELDGVPGGVVPLNSSGSISTSYIPASIKTHRAPLVKYADTVNLSGTQAVSSPVGVKKYLAATMTISDPGYPYIPLPFAVVRGGALGSPDPVTRSMTTSSYGQLTVLDSDNVKYGWTVCSGRKVYDFHTLVPFADDKVNPTTQSLVEGDLTLDLWLGLYGGTGYTFTSTGFSFYTICFPGVR